MNNNFCNLYYVYVGKFHIGVIELSIGVTMQLYCLASHNVLTLLVYPSIFFACKSSVQVRIDLSEGQFQCIIFSGYFLWAISVFSEICGVTIFIDNTFRKNKRSEFGWLRRSCSSDFNSLIFLLLPLIYMPTNDGPTPQRSSRI